MVSVNIGAALISLVVVIVALLKRRTSGSWVVAWTALAAAVWGACAAIDASYGEDGGYRGDWVVYWMWLSAVALVAFGAVVIERRLAAGQWSIPRWLAVTGVIDLLVIFFITHPDIAPSQLADQAQGTREYSIGWMIQAIYVFGLLFFVGQGVSRQAVEAKAWRRTLLGGFVALLVIGFALQAAQIQVMALPGALAVACLAGVVVGTRGIEAAEDAQRNTPVDLHTLQLEEALRDPVTGLIGRYALERVFDDLSATDQFAILVTDVDGLKPTNDTYGHQLGDQYLKAVAARIELVVGAAGTVGRFGGDEFVVVLPHVLSEDAVELAEAIVTAVHCEFRVGEISLTPTVSVGVGWNDGAMEVAEVLGHADSAMYDAKRLGGDRSRVSDPIG